MTTRLALTWNVVANAAGRGWSAVLQFALTPFVLHLLGPEHFGFIGFAMTLTAVFSCLDQAVSPVLIRSLAQGRDGGAGAPAAADELRTLEVVSWCTALAVGGAIVITAPFLARHLMSDHGVMAMEERTRCIRLIGLWISALWPGFLYGSAFVGLERQDLLVAVRAVLGTIGAVGGVLILWLVGPDLGLYLAWQAAASLLMSATLRATLTRIMPNGRKAGRFTISLLARSHRFALGNLLIGVSSMLLTQAPPLIIAKYRSLADLSAYTLAALLAQQGLTILTHPVLGTLLPRLVWMIGERNEERLVEAYHRWTSLVLSLILPIAASLVWFPREIAGAWLGMASPVVGAVAALLPWIALGTLLNTAMSLPILLQIASGWTRLSALKNLVAVAVLVPSLVMLVPGHGPLVAAWAWFGLNAGYYLFEVPLMHARLLRGELWSWWLQRTLLPVVLVISAAAPIRLALPSSMAPAAGAAAAIGSAAALWIGQVILQPGVRRDIAGFVRVLASLPGRRA